MKNFEEYIFESENNDIKFEDIVDVDKLLKFAQDVYSICFGEGYLYYNPKEFKISISLPDANLFDDESVIDVIKNNLIKDYDNEDKIVYEVDNEFVPSGEGWLRFNANKNKFVEK